MTMPQQGGQPDTVHEVPMSEGGAVAEVDCAAACEMAVESAMSHREQAGRMADM